LPEAKAQTVKQLGVFATEDILPGQQILQEKSLLTAVSRLHESFCDACSMPLPEIRDVSAQTGMQDVIISCQECDEVFFCSEHCHDLAQESYHPSLCGVSFEQKVSASEAADSLYTLLIIRALALAETQNLNPLELREVRYIWGDYHGLDVYQLTKPETDAFGGLPRTLPFSFNANVLRPLHVLEKMDVNIFEQSHRYDTWIFNTLYAKLRGKLSSTSHSHLLSSDIRQVRRQPVKVSTAVLRLVPCIQCGVSPTTAVTQTWVGNGREVCDFGLAKSSWTGKGEIPVSCQD
jgi:hypothetical protein